MKSNRWARPLHLSWFVFLLTWSCNAQDLVYETTEATAIARAKAEGKMVLTDFGRPSCSDCVVMEATFGRTNPPVKQWLQASCVLWSANVDNSSEWQPYASGLGSFSLPLLCFVDPAKPGTYISRRTSLIPTSTFLAILQKEAQKNLPLLVTNLPGAPLSNADFVVKGVARTNAALAGSISNAPIECIMWRLNGTGPFQPGTGTTNWSAAVSLPLPTNTFESYVQYEGPKHSWTNRVILITSNPRPRSDQIITFGPLPEHIYGDSPFVLTASASSGLPVSYSSGNPNVATVSGNIVTIVGVGRTDVTASQEGNADYLPAAAVTQTLVVKPLVPGDTDYNGFVDQEELNAVLAHYWAKSPPYIGNIAIAGQTSFTFTITNFTFGVEFTTDPANPDWQPLGRAYFQFTDPNAVVDEQRYYRLVAP